MVMSFFRGGGEEGLERIEHEIASMLQNCRHSFDLAMGALVSDADIGPVGDEVRSTDRSINGAEETVRRELVVHSTVHGGGHVGAVLAYLLIVKKLERVGDQAKNVFDLAAEGVRFSRAADHDEFVEFRNTVSGLFAEAADLLAADSPDVAEFTDRSQTLMDRFDRMVNDLFQSDDPARHAVPRAMLYRYLKRIVANLVGVVTTVSDGIDRIGPDGDIDE